MSRSGCVCAAIALTSAPLPFADAVTVGGDVSFTSDYIYRGLSETDGRPAAQIDIHASTLTGTFAGVWASTRRKSVAPGASADVEYYIGQRYDISPAWSTSLSATDYTYVGGNKWASNDYQQISAGVSYLDRWTLTLSGIPNAVRYYYYERLARYPAYIAETTGQWDLGTGFLLTGGAGYYYFSQTHWPRNSPSGYAYGNIGAAYQLRQWRLDAGYFLVQKEKARLLFPYASGNRFAATLSYHF